MSQLALSGVCASCAEGAGATALSEPTYWIGPCQICGEWTANMDPDDLSWPGDEEGTGG